MKRAVIIGSGMGGLCSAVLLARAGWSVTVLERHTRPGGCLHRFYREGLGYDTGFHYVGSARPDQTFGRALAHLGVYDQLRWHPLSDEGFDVLRYPGFELRVPTGLSRYGQRLVDAFPRERAGVERYLEIHQQAVSAYGWFRLDPSVDPAAILPWEERSLRDVLDLCFQDPRIKAVVAGQAALYGVPPSDAPFGLHAVVTDHFLQGAWTIEGGGDRLAMALVRRIRALGGEVLLKTPATGIALRDRGVEAVRTEDGRSFPADLVVANIHPRLVLDLLPPGAVRPAYATRVREARPGIGHLGLYLRVEGDLEPLRGRNLYRFRTWDLEEAAAGARPGHVPLTFATWSGQGAPEGHAARQVVLGLVPCATDLFRAWAGSDPAARPDLYQDLKRRLADDALAALREDFPSWEILRAEASTPLTVERFLGTPEGATYGHYHGVQQMGRYRLPMVTRVSGLLQVGQCVAFPGVCGALMSAYVALSRLPGMERLIEELRG